jgi:hypothetical protein
MIVQVMLKPWLNVLLATVFDMQCYHWESVVIWSQTRVLSSY